MRQAPQARSGGDLGGMPADLDEEPTRPYASTRLAYELSHVVDGRPAALKMTPPGDQTEAQARRFASTGRWGPR